jgi:alcohol dehydrogenase class IV
MQQEYFGNNSLEQLKTVLEKLAPGKIFLVVGQQSFASSGAEKALKKILAGYQVTTFSDFGSPPELNGVRKGITSLKQSEADVVIAVGGGRVIDTAKLINILAVHQGEPKSYLIKEKRITKKGRPLIAVPTTSGSGSDATHFAVIYVDKVKYSLAHDYILPDVSIYDPQLTASASPYQTSASGFDALSQAIESYWSVNSTAESQAYAQEAISLVLEHLVMAVKKPTPLARLKMAQAAHLAGKAINLTKTTAAHAISYPFTARYGVSHGHAVGLTLGNLYWHNSRAVDADVVDKRGVEHVRQTFAQLNALLNCADAQAARRKLYDLMSQIGLASRLPEVGVKTDQDVQIIMDNVDLERLQNNPRAISRPALKAIVTGEGLI